MDCDDTDPTSTVGVAEIENGLDDDCDGLVDEGFNDAGDLVITEVMVNPDAVSDTLGEYFEVYNATTQTIDMDGWTVYSDDGSSMTISGSLLIAAGDYAVLGVESDSTLNGGVTLDYEYVRSTFSFADTADSIYIVSGTTTVAELSFATSSSWPIGTAGKAMFLDDDHYATADNNLVTYWCASRTELSGGDYGSPGESGGDCYLDDDGDGYRYSDCDDDDPDRNAGETEIVNGVDDYVDEDLITATAQPRVVGGSSSAMVNLAGIGDFDGDGTTEAVLYQSGASTAYVLATSGYSGWAGLTPADYDESYKTFSSTAQNYRGSPLAPADVTGDGSLDLVYANYASGGSAGFVVVAGPFTTTATGVGPSYRFAVTESSGSSQVKVRVGNDFDGDGVDEIVYRNSQSNTDGYTGSGAIAIIEQSSLGSAMDYSSASVVLTGGASGRSLGQYDAVGDFDGDGYADVAAYSGSTSSLYVWYGDAFATTGKVSMSSKASATLSMTAGSLAVDDVDGDGTLDLAVSNSSTVKMNWYLDLGSFAGSSTPTADVTFDPDDFGSSYRYAISATPVLYDADGDGDDEVGIAAYGYFSDTTLAFFAHDAFADDTVTADEASYVFAMSSPQTTSNALVGIGYDLDGDGDDELVLGDYTWTSGTTPSAGGVFVIEP
jgi:hypothetical protein